MGRIILSCLLLTSASLTLAESNKQSWYNIWWNNVFEQHIVEQQYQQIQQEQISKCDQKIQWYSEKVNQYPNSEYYKYKKEQWVNRCLP